MAAETSGLAKKMEELAIREDDQGLPEVFDNLKVSSEELLRELTGISKELLSEDPSL